MGQHGSLELVSDGHGLLEGPVFSSDLGLVVADITNGGVLLFSPGTQPRQLIAHRRGIGGMAFHADGGLVVSGRNVAHKRLTGNGAGEETTVVLGNDPQSGILSFNDLVTDAAGRIYVGSVAFDAMHTRPDEPIDDKPAGKLHMIDLDGSAHEVAKGILLSNGLGFSPDGKRLYHSDTLRRRINVFDVADDGMLYGEKCFATIQSGMPDGLAVAEDGSVWVALYLGGAVSAFSPDGHEIAHIEIDSPLVTSVCFGGEDWGELFVVTGPSPLSNRPGGCIYKTRTGVRGVSRPLSRVRRRN